MLVATLHYTPTISSSSSKVGAVEEAAPLPLPLLLEADSLSPNGLLWAELEEEEAEEEIVAAGGGGVLFALEKAFFRPGIVSLALLPQSPLPPLPP